MSKIDLQDFVRFGGLFEVYGALLSEDRQKTMSSYFDFNMTLAEIAEEKKVSRQAVLDTIEKSCQKLLEFENALGILKKKQSLQTSLQKTLEIAIKKGDRQIQEKVEKILKEI